MFDLTDDDNDDNYLYFAVSDQGWSGIGWSVTIVKSDADTTR